MAGGILDRLDRRQCADRKPGGSPGGRVRWRCWQPLSPARSFQRRHHARHDDAVAVALSRTGRDANRRSSDARHGGCDGCHGSAGVFVALGLVFDPRYRDFPFAPLTATVVPLLLHSLTVPRPGGSRGAAELSAAVVAGAVGRLYRAQRKLRELAVAVDLRRAGGAGAYSVSGARRARLRISSPTASADSACCRARDPRGERQRHREQHQRRPQQIEQRDRPARRCRTPNW